MNHPGPLRRLERRRRPKAKSLLASACLFCASSSTALAGDWTIEGRLNATVDAYQKYGTLSDGSGPYLAFTETATSNFIYRTHDSNFTTVGTIVAKQFLGAEDTENSILPRLSTSYNKSGKRLNVSVGASYAFEYIPDVEEFDVLDETADTTDAYRHNFSVNGSVAYKINRRNSVSLSATGSQTRYDGPGIDSSSLSANLRWNRSLTKLTDANIGPGVRWIIQDDTANTSTVIYSANAGLSTRLTKRLSATVGAGVNVVDSSKDDLFGERESTLTPGFSFDASLSYVLKTVTIGASASYGLDTSALGELENSGNASISLSKTINDHSSFSVALSGQVGQSYEQSLEEGALENVTWGLSFSPSYSYTLARNWDLRTGYRFKYIEGSDGAGTSHNVFMALSHKFTVLP
jgi:opacity protein-like surface antigen